VKAIVVRAQGGAVLGWIDVRVRLTLLDIAAGRTGPSPRDAHEVCADPLLQQGYRTHVMSIAHRAQCPLSVGPFTVAGVTKSSAEEGETMTTLENRPNTALLVIDVQIGNLEAAHERHAVVANISDLVEQARREGVPIVWVQHSDEQLKKGSESWQIVPELKPADAEPIVEKHYADSFENTTLETVLAGLDAGRLIVAGAQTDECIRATLHGAVVRGYDAILVSDAHTTDDHTEWGAPPPDAVIAHTNLYWTYHRAPGRTAGTVTTTQVSFSDRA